MNKLFVIAEVINEKPSIDMMKQLFLEYAQSLNFSLCFQNFQKELDELPGVYSPPKGLLCLALVNGKPAGCIALKPLGDKVCEMKRLYVRPEFRGLGIGKSLANHLIARARELAYDKMRLDTISTMKEAMALYRSSGFYEIEPYYNNPVEGAHYMEKNLNE
ncbi:MAG: GNAT family N-acetyltransferase [Candidatus Atribacteria bacterium]|nr:GNAT family N-acetyltransferase [Candidatus Atribacteria bacterium]